MFTDMADNNAGTVNETKAIRIIWVILNDQKRIPTVIHFVIIMGNSEKVTMRIRFLHAIKDSLQSKI